MRDQAFKLLKQHVNLSPERFEKLSLYHGLLLRWQSKINLVGPDTIPDVWQRHFLDSLQLLNHLPDAGVMLDIGSGAGFPGMALAVCGVKNMHLIESDARKITFLEEVARVTNTNVFIHHGRIEDHLIAKADIILSRACSDLDQLLVYASSYVSHETICFFHKGKNYSKEILDAEKNWVFYSTIIPSVTNIQGVILKLTTISRRG